MGGHKRINHTDISELIDKLGGLLITSENELK